METLEKESALSVEDDGRSGCSKDATADENSRSCTSWLCVIEGETCKA